MAHGWLARDDSLGWTVEGVNIAPETRTRNVEYRWAADQLLPKRGITLLDAASGYVPTWHMLPYIAAKLGYLTVAVDMNEASLSMPACVGVRRELGDITSLRYADDSFDAVACISTLEHLGPTEQALAARELCRIARHKVIITADEAPWLPELFLPYLVIGDQWDFAGDHLSPPVYALSGTPRRSGAD